MKCFVYVTEADVVKDIFSRRVTAKDSVLAFCLLKETPSGTH